MRLLVHRVPEQTCERARIRRDLEQHPNLQLDLGSSENADVSKPELAGAFPSDSESSAQRSANQLIIERPFEIN